MDRRLDGKVAVVTGATGALGSAVVERFVAEGALVHATYRGDDGLEALRRRVGGDHALTGHRLDLTDEQAVGRCFDDVLAAAGHLDVLANVAGGFAGGTVADSSAEKLDQMLSVNLRTCFLCCRKAAELLGAGGRIINVSAQAALRPAARTGCYAASKAAVGALTAALARELAGAGVTVNAILPGTLDTPANRRAMPKADFAKWTPPEAVAEVFAFLASDAAACVSGAQIPV